MAASKRLYESVAADFRRVRNDQGWREHRAVALDVLEEMAGALAVTFAGDNPRFDRPRFLAACRGEDSMDAAGRKVTYSR